MLKGMLLGALQQLCGINLIIMNYFQFSNEGLNADRTLSIIILGIVNCISSIPIIFFINSIERMNIIKFGALGMIFSWIIVIVYQFIRIELLWWVGIYAFLICFEFSIGPLFWIYCADVLNAKGSSITTATNWMSCLIVHFLNPYLS